MNPSISTFRGASRQTGWEVLPFAGLAAGTVRTSASVGSECRWGRSLPDDFGTAAIAFN